MFDSGVDVYAAKSQVFLGIYVATRFGEIIQLKSIIVGLFVEVNS